MKLVNLLTSVWYGDHTEVIYFPDDWDINLIEATYQNAINDEDLRYKIRNPIGTPSLSELVKGKRRVVILIDDIQRPTPVKRIVLSVLDELERGGISKDKITIVMATACHRPAIREDFLKKLGSDVVKTVRILSHDCRKDLTHLGKTSRGTPIYINKLVADCDFKIGISGVYPHESGGFGGGSKIIHPGVCGIETARYLHNHIQGTLRGSSKKSEFRADIEEVADVVGLDFAVNIVLNQKRKICNLFSGHRILSHREAVQCAQNSYEVTPVEDADIVVANCYPFDTSLHFISKGLWPLRYGKERSSKVVIASCPEGLGYHGLSLSSYRGLSGFLKRARALSSHDIRLFLSGARNKESDFLLFSPYITQREAKKIYKRAKVFNVWDAVLRELIQRHKTPNLKVTIYACSPLQIPSHLDA